MIFIGYNFIVRRICAPSAPSARKCGAAVRATQSLLIRELLTITLRPRTSTRWGLDACVLQNIAVGLVGMKEFVNVSVKSTKTLVCVCSVLETANGIFFLFCLFCLIYSIFIHFLLYFCACYCSARNRVACDERRRKSEQRRCEAVMHACFDGQPELLHEFSNAFCDSLVCSDEGLLVHSIPPTVAVRERPTWWAHISFYLFAIPHFLAFMGTFYAVMYLYTRESTVKDDLQRLGVQRRHWQLKWMQKGKVSFLFEFVLFVCMSK